MDGWEVARQAREIDPDFPVVYMSGASAVDCPLRCAEQHHAGQPFAPAQLVTALANLLNTGTPIA